jgi:hypothetical protein
VARLQATCTWEATWGRRPAEVSPTPPPLSLAPIPLSYEYSYSKTFLATIGERARKYPWTEKQKALFSNPGGYHRRVHSTLACSPTLLDALLRSPPAARLLHRLARGVLALVPQAASQCATSACNTRDYAATIQSPEEPAAAADGPSALLPCCRHIANHMTERQDHQGNSTNMPRRAFVWAAIAPLHLVLAASASAIRRGHRPAGRAQAPAAASPH